MVIAAIIIASMLWLLRYRFSERFIRVYGLFFLILLYFGLYRGSEVGPGEIEGTFSPLSLMRWAMLGVLLIVAIRVPKPKEFRSDIPLATLAILFLFYILVSTTYAEDISYSLMRAASFVAFSAAILSGFIFHFYWRVNCVKFFRFHYYLAWLALAPPMLLYLLGLSHYGVAVLGGQYAGAFGNQNLLGVFSALITPYVLFHWRAEAQTSRQRWMDIALLVVIFAGLWFSRSRGGTLACAIAIATYFIVISQEGRIKIIVAGLCLIIGIVAFPTLKQSAMKFIRKDTIERVEVEGIGKQIIEERRYDLWKGVLPLYWEKKLTGYGFAMSHILTFPFSGDKDVGRHVHNSYLELFGDLGLPGVLFLLLILCGLAARAFTLIVTGENPLQRNINAVFISVFVAGAVNAFFESWMFSVGNIVTLMFWGPTAGIVAQWAWGSVRVENREEIVGATHELAYSLPQRQSK